MNYQADIRGPRAGFDESRQAMLTNFRWLLRNPAIPHDELAQEIEATASAMRQLLELAK